MKKFLRNFPDPARLGLGASHMAAGMDGMNRGEDVKQSGSRNQLVPRLCYGSLAVSSLQRPFTAEEGARLIVRAAERGVEWVDTAEYYDNYGTLAIALKERPGLRVITKSYAYDRDGALASVGKALNGMGRGYLDVFLMHEQEGELTVRGHWEALKAYRELRDEGVIGRVGLSTHRVAGVRAAVKYRMDVVCAIINMDGIGLTDGSREDMECALEEAHEAGLLVIGMKALGGGHLIAKRREAIEYVRSLRCLDLIAVGMASEAEIDYNTAVFSGRDPDTIAAKISGELERTLMIEEGCIGCGRCIERCGQAALELLNGQATAHPEKCIRCGYCARVCPQVCIKVV